VAAHIGTPLQFATESGTALSSYSVPFTSGVAAGRLLVCSIARSYTSGGDIPLVGISDDAGNTWRYVGLSSTGTSSTVIGYVAVCYVTNPISQGDELHVTFQATQGRCAIVVEAFDATPANPADPVEAFAAAHVTSAQSTVAAAEVSFTPPALLVCCIAGAGQTNQLATVGSGWQALTRVGTAQPTSAYRFTQQMWTEAGSSPQTATGTFTANTTHSTLTIAIPLADGPEPPPVGEPHFAEWDGTRLVPLTPMQWDGEKLIPLEVKVF